MDNWIISNNLELNFEALQIPCWLPYIFQVWGRDKVKQGPELRESQIYSNVYKVLRK